MTLRLRGQWALLALLLAGCGHPRLPAAPAPEAGPPRGAVERGRMLARALLARDTLPGLSVAVASGGRVVWAEGFGWADVERRVPVTPLTRFRIGSISKPLTSAAVGLLQEHGRLDLDAPVQEYVPGFPRKRWPVSTRQLMGHVAGVRHYRDEAEALRSTHCGDVLDGLAAFAGDSLLFRPGTRYAYSSYGWTLVGAAVQGAAGEPFAAFMRRAVFEPLGMLHTGPEPVRDAPEQATGYVRSSGAPAPAPAVDNSCVLPAGGFVSTPSDLARFGAALAGGRLLAPRTVELLWTPLRLESGESTGYGLGWFTRTVRLGGDAVASRMLGHGGNSVGGTAWLLVFPEQGLVVAVATNVTGAEGLNSFATRLADIFRAR